MDRFPAAIDKHFDAICCHKDGGIILGASSLNGRYWLGSLWFYNLPENAGNLEKCTAGVQLESGVSDVIWLNDNRVLLGLDTGGLETWDLEENFKTFSHVHTVVEHDDLVSNVGHLYQSKKGVSGSHDRSIKVWDLDLMSSLHTATVHTDSITSVKCHPSEGNLFVSCGMDGQVIMWDLRNSKPALLLDISPLNGLPTSLAWQGEGRFSLACGSDAGDIVFKDIRNAMATPVHFTPHSRCVYRLEFSSVKNNLLASVSEDCTAVITSLNGNPVNATEQVKRHVEHTDFIHGLSWDSSGEHIYTCSWDSTVKSVECPKVSCDTEDISAPASDDLKLNGNLNGNTIMTEVEVAEGNGQSDIGDQTDLEADTCSESEQLKKSQHSMDTTETTQVP